MATITINNVPETFIKKYFKTDFSFDELLIKPKKPVKDPTIRLQKLIEDPDNTNYGPFYKVEDAIDFLNRDLCR